MDFFEVVRLRRSIRRYTSTPVPESVIEKALDAALLAPNSSNMQTWGFYWVKSPDKKQKAIEACLSQGAARTAQEIIFIVAKPSMWKKTRAAMFEHMERAGSPKIMNDYYSKVIPLVYGFHILAPLKWLIYQSIGLFRPIMRRPWSPRDVQEVSIKSAALAAENFMLAIRAQGFDTCPMEGLDEVRVKRLLGLGSGDRIVMGISVGERDPKGLWGEQIRFPRDWFIHRV